MPAPPTDFLALKEYCDSLAGFDLSETERDRLLNEGYQELCVRSHFSKATRTLTAPFGYAFSWPSDVRKILTLYVDGEAALAGDETLRRDVQAGRASISSGGAMWWRGHTEAGVPYIGVYPTPEASTLVQIECVVAPAALEDDTDEPIVPLDFRQAIVDYVTEFALGREEDDGAMREFHRDAFERAVGRLRMLVNEMENGEGPIQVLIKGAHWG